MTYININIDHISISYYESQDMTMNLYFIHTIKYIHPRKQLVIFEALYEINSSTVIKCMTFFSYNKKNVACLAHKLVNIEGVDSVVQQIMRHTHSMPMKISVGDTGC